MMLVDSIGCGFSIFTVVMGIAAEGRLLLATFPKFGFTGCLRPEDMGLPGAVVLLWVSPALLQAL